MRVMEKCLSSLRKQGPIRRGLLVPTFRSSYTISAITFYELRKAMGTSKFMILVPLFDLKSLGSFRRLRCRDFKSAALALIGEDLHQARWLHARKFEYGKERRQQSSRHGDG